MGVWNGNVVKLSFDDSYTTINIKKLIEFKNKKINNKTSLTSENEMKIEPSGQNLSHIIICICEING